MKIRVAFGARSLVGANDGVDREACAARYAGLVTDALRREWPDAEVEVTWTDERKSTRATVEGAASIDAARDVERTALDLAGIVREVADWSA